MRRGAKRGKVSAVPEVLTSNATENSVTLEEIDNVDSFVQRLERIQLPNQVIAVLSDPLLQKYLSLKPSAAATRRMEHWLSASLEEELQCLDDRQQEPGRLSGLLDSILIYARYTKVGSLLWFCRDVMLTKRRKCRRHVKDSLRLTYRAGMERTTERLSLSSRLSCP